MRLRKKKVKPWPDTEDKWGQKNAEAHILGLWALGKEIETKRNAGTPECLIKVPNALS